MFGNRYETKLGLQSIAESMDSNFKAYRCERQPAHGCYEFVCTHPDCQFDRLVCADCLKDDASHIQAHGPHFYRIKELVRFFGWQTESLQE